MSLSLRDEHESGVHVEIDRLVHLIQTCDDFSRNVVSEHSVPQASSDEVISPTPSALQSSVSPVPHASAAAAPSDSRECGVCFEPIEKMVILVPCFHARFCEKCARSVTECPECRATISDVRVPYV